MCPGGLITKSRGGSSPLGSRHEGPDSIRADEGPSAGAIIEDTMTLRPEQLTPEDFRRRNEMIQARMNELKRLMLQEEDFKRMGAFLGALTSTALLIPFVTTWPVYGSLPMLLAIALIVRWAFMFVIRRTLMRRAMERFERECPMPEKIDFS